MMLFATIALALLPIALAFPHQFWSRQAPGNGTKSQYLNDKSQRTSVTQ